MPLTISRFFSGRGPEPAGEPSPGWLAVPLLGAVLGYARSLHGEFVFDDVTSIVNDPLAHDLGASTRALWASMFSAGGVQPGGAAMVRSAALDGGRAVTAWTFACNHAWGGTDPFGYHLVNLGLHLAVVVLVFLLVVELLGRADCAGRRACGLAVAGGFALHPLSSQAVSYLTQRSEVLASAAYLGALLLLLRVRAAPRYLGALLVLAALLLFSLGLGAKPIVVSMPVAYLLIEWVLPDRRSVVVPSGSWLRPMAVASPFLACAAWKTRGLLHAVEGKAHVGFAVAVPGLRPWTYFISQWKVMLVYLRLLFWPTGQSVDWLYPVSQRLDLAAGLAGAVLLVLIGGAALLVGKGRRRGGSRAGLVAGLGVLWFLLLLAPTSSVIPLADLLVEHRVYLASAGLLLAAVLGIRAATVRLGPSFPVVIALVWGALGMALHRRNAVWESAVALWSDAVAKNPANGRAHAALGLAYQRQGDLGAAIREHGRAMETLPRGDVENRLLVATGLAAALADSGHPEPAVAVLRAALALRPEDENLLATLGAAELRAGHLEEAERAARDALALQGGHPQAWLTLGEARLASGDVAGAVHGLEAAARADPGEPVRLLLLGQALAQQGRREQACRSWLEAARSPRSRADDRRKAAELTAELGCRGR